MNKPWALCVINVRNHWDGEPSTRSKKLLAVDESPEALIERFNKKMEGTADQYRLPEDPQFPEGVLEYQHRGSTGGGCMGVMYYYTIKKLEEFDDAKTE